MSDNSKRSKEFAKNTAILTFGKICTQSISFLLLPLYTAILEPADYGAVDLIVTYNTLLLTLVALQFDQGLCWMTGIIKSVILNCFHPFYLYQLFR